MQQYNNLAMQQLFVLKFKIKNYHKIC